MTVGQERRQAGSEIDQLRDFGFAQLVDDDRVGAAKPPESIRGKPTRLISAEVTPSGTDHHNASYVGCGP